MSEEQAYALPVYPQKVDDLISEALEGMDEVIWVNGMTGDSFSLNAIASAVLELCDGQHTHEQIVSFIDGSIDSSQTNRAEVVNDVQGMIIMFYQSGLLKIPV
ncbi:MAG: PqqD family peptide modification chaperone [Mariprofundaceae bacterium]|nr:PqqD family peptide modification chaperone [Mariprofundaceae bacterium]